MADSDLIQIVDNNDVPVGVATHEEVKGLVDTTPELVTDGVKATVTYL